MTKEEKKFIIIGIVFIATIVFSIWGFWFLKGNNPFIKDRYYYAVFDKIEGLAETSPVIINGFRVGQIWDIKFTDKSAKKIIVKFIIEKDVKITKCTVAEIVSLDFLGTKGLNLKIDYNCPQIANPGDTLPSAIEKSYMEIISPYLDSLKTTIQHTNQILNKINQQLNQQTFLKLQQIISTTLKIAQNLQQITAPNSQLNQTIQNLQQLSAQLNQDKEKISKIITNTQQFTDTLKNLNLNQTVLLLNKNLQTLDTLLTLLKSETSTTGKLLYSDSLYNQLDSLLQNLNQLIENINQNPRKYLKISVF